jgi:hypothetical protein
MGVIEFFPNIKPFIKQAHMGLELFDSALLHHTSQPNNNYHILITFTTISTKDPKTYTKKVDQQNINLVKQFYKFLLDEKGKEGCTCTTRKCVLVHSGFH